VGAVVKGLQSVVAEAREAQKVGAITAQVIKTTGGSANVSAGQVEKLATSLSNKAGVDDEVIQKGANLLLTFKNVRNEVGKGNKIFDQATAAAVDLSAAGFGSVDSASKMLGKALNDPVKGMTALGRAGVTFTKSQEKQIKAMVKQGDLLGAQKIILGEVQSQVGGAAAASATAGEKLSVAWGNFKETIGTALLPILDRLMNFIAQTVLPGILKLGPVFTKIGDFIKPAIAGVQAFFSGSTAGSGKLTAFMTTVSSVFASVKSIFMSFVTIVQALWAWFGGIITSYVVVALKNLLTIVRGAFKVLEGIFNVIAGILTGDWSRVWKGIQQIVKGAWTVIKGIVSQGWNIIKTLFKVAGAIIKGIFVGLWNVVKSLAKAGMDKLKSAISDGVKKAIQFFKDLPGKIKSALGNMGKLLLNAGKAVLQGLIDGIQSKFSALKSKLGSVTKLIPSWKGPPKKDAKLLSPAGQSIIDGLIVGMKSREQNVKTTLRGLTSDIAATELSVARNSTATIGASLPGNAPMEFSLVGARVELDKNGFATFVDGRIRLNNRQGALQARYATP
jgi:phage-related protein